MLPDELLHQTLQIFVMQHDDLDPLLLQILLTSNKILVLANYDTLYLVYVSIQCRSPGSRIKRTLYMTQAPVHISQGERLVYMVAPWYTEAGRRPAFSRHDISAWWWSGHHHHHRHHQNARKAATSAITNMKCGATLLDAHIVALAEDLAISADQAGPDWDTTLFGAFVRLVKGDFESNV